MWAVHLYQICLLDPDPVRELVDVKWFRRRWQAVLYSWWVNLPFGLSLFVIEGEVHEHAADDAP